VFLKTNDKLLKKKLININNIFDLHDPIIKVRCF